MIEPVCRINIKLADVEFDKAKNAIVFRNIAVRGSTVALIGGLMELLTKVANGKGSAIESRKKKAGFQLEASKFEVAAHADYIQIYYDFSENSLDLINSAKDIVCDVLNFHFSGLTESIKQLSNEDQPALDSYKASSFTNAHDAYVAIKKLYEIAKLQKVSDFEVQIEGHRSPHQIEIISSPEKPVFSPEGKEITLIEYEIKDAHKEDLSVEIAPRQGKGKKTIFLSAEQYSLLHDSQGYSIEAFVLYDFTVKHLKEKEYELVSATFSGSQVEIDF